ncbi:hypothetical protein IRY61_03900 [Candidatus Saccharibacteria bacterium]|nr:hypothetical protein [Candidatus Saccharibacteria bacterium]
MKESEPKAAIENAAIENDRGETIPGPRQPEDDRVTGASPVDLLGAPYKGSNNPAGDGPKQEYVPNVVGLVTAAADAEMAGPAELVEQPDVAEKKTTELHDRVEPMREATRRARGVAGLVARAAVSGSTVYKSIFAGDRSDPQKAIAEDYWNKKEQHEAAQATQEGAVNPKGDGPSAYGALLVDAYLRGDYSEFYRLLGLQTPVRQSLNLEFLSSRSSLELQTPVRQSLKDTLRNRFTDLARWAKGIKAALLKNGARLLDAVDALATGVPQLAEVQKAKDVAKKGWQRAKHAPRDILSAAYDGLINKPRQWAQVKIDRGKNEINKIGDEIAQGLRKIEIDLAWALYRWVISRVAAAEALKTTVEVGGQTETPATTTADATDNK